MSGAERTLATKRRLGRLWRAIRSRPQGPIVLLYHSIGATPWAVPTTAFESQIAQLAKTFAFVDPAQAVASVSAGTCSRSIAITFDDGYASLLHEAAPVLQRYGASASAFINTGCISDTERRLADTSLGHYPKEVFLLWSEVERLARLRWTIGSHGVDHLDLTKCPSDIVEEQLATSRATIRGRGLGDCDSFAYTWGRNSPIVRRLVAAAGYRMAFGTVHGALSPSSDVYALPRINVDPAWSLDDFAAVIEGDWDYLHWVQRARSRLE